MVFDVAGLKVDSRVEGLSGTIGEALLTPTKIYSRTVLKVIEKVKVKGIAHITGGGLPENVARILPKGSKAVFERIKRGICAEIFKVLKKLGGIDDKEMFKAFNMGIGMVLVVDRKDASKAAKACPAAWLSGRSKKARQEVEIL